jgi:hypothetical protein
VQDCLREIKKIESFNRMLSPQQEKTHCLRPSAPREQDKVTPKATTISEVTDKQMTSFQLLDQREALASMLPKTID